MWLGSSHPASGLATMDAEIRSFYAAAGVEQYADQLIEDGFDSLSNLLTLDESGLSDLKTAVTMKSSHLASLRAKIAMTAPPGAPLHTVPLPLAAAAAGWLRSS